MKIKHTSVMVDDQEKALSFIRRFWALLNAMTSP
jgi:hypothetical protein